MSERKFTEGPWEYRKATSGNYKCRVMARSGIVSVATIHAGVSQDANGALIASAPSLLAALKAISRAYEDMAAQDNAPDVYDLEIFAEGVSNVARAALASATLAEGG